MSECKALCGAGCKEDICSKLCPERVAAWRAATPAPVDRQAGCVNIDSHPPVKKFPPRSCFNKTYAPGYWVLTRKWFDDGRFELVNEWVPHRTSTDCKYDRRDDDKACVGCKWNPPVAEEVVLCQNCGDWTVLDDEGVCEMCGQEYRHVEHDDFDMER